MQPGNTDKSDWEREQEKREWREADVPTPPRPGAARCCRSSSVRASDFRFFVDAASIASGADGVVRYTLVARSPLGAENVTYEGIRCATGEVNAPTRPAGRTAAGRCIRGEWRRIEARSVQRWHDTLWQEYFCPRKWPIRSAAEGVDALQRAVTPRRIAIPARGY